MDIRRGRGAMEEEAYAPAERQGGRSAEPGCPGIYDQGDSRYTKPDRKHHRDPSQGTLQKAKCYQYDGGRGLCHDLPPAIKAMR